MDTESLIVPARTHAIRVGMSGMIGRGVFAEQHFEPGELIETAPVLVIPAAEWPLLEKTRLFSYCYAFGDNGSECEDMALALGLGSMYNHSYTPNARYVKNLKEQMIAYYAIREIAFGEEITINYNGDPACRDPLWFPVASA